MSSPRPSSSLQSGLRWHQGLQFRLGLLFALLLAVLGGVAFFAADRLIGRGLEQATFRFETAINQRLLAETGQIVRSTEQFAQLLALTATNPDAALRARLGERLLQNLPIASYGLWPEPLNTAAGTRRSSQFWRITDSGKPEARDDYNAPDAIAYWREPWYTPSRIAGGSRCLWSPVYRDPLLARDVVTCSVAIIGARGFEGVATVSVDIGKLSRLFLTGGEALRSYAVLSDRSGQMLAVSALARDRLGAVVGSSRNLPELAQREARYNPVALAIHRRSEAFRADALRSASYDARLVSSLKDNSRELSRVAAEDALAAVWNANDGRAADAPERLKLDLDPVLGESSYAVLSTVPDAGWQLLSVSPTREGNDAMIYLVTQALIVTLGTAVLVLVVAFVLLRGTVIRPLRRMTQAIARAEQDDQGTEQDVTLDESGAGELRLLAHWHNERSGRLRDLQDRASLALSQLHSETAERVRAQDQSLRLGERNQLLMSSLDDGIAVLDEQGAIVELNAIAEQWLSTTQRNARGAPFGSVLQARLGSLEGPALPDLMQQIRDTGARIDFPDGVILVGNGAQGHERGQDLGRELGLSAVPIRSRVDRITGCLVVLRRAGGQRVAGPLSGSVAQEFVDPVTGLGGRKACERRVRELHAQAQNAGREGRNDEPLHALAKLDFPELRRVRETRSHSDADALAARCGERLAALSGGSDHVFRLTPDRFAVLIEARTGEQARLDAEALRAHIAEQRLLSGDDWIEVHAVIGLCLISADVGSAAEVMRRAGIACDHARRSQAVVLHGAGLEVGTGIDQETLWVRRIERGLEERLFHVTTQRLQPSRALASEGEVFEVLLALEDEEGFWAPSSLFLPIAERHLLGSQLDRWVIQALFERLAADSALCGRMASCGVHLSEDSLHDATLISFIAEQINSHPDVPIGKLCFELRDDTLTGNPQQAKRCCEALRRLGAKIAIDHRTGRQIGYVEQLRGMPVDYVKLDAAQFQRIAEDDIEQALAESALKLARLIGGRTIIGAVDSEAQATIWRRLGADYLQGQAIAKPSPVPFRS
ncbi:EAL domain-containing protein [uncultured Nevskia sp.]|uniref:EAL domain-containing protein n=1 Tax=uncultured Nevskia sp. TaxID=228950 RepID=UPI0025F47E55|nr:EAL domain-containing protein [uncultured Nevskia sp.]